jgi:hypothetical protein
LDLIGEGNAETLMAVDVGSVNTRASLFDAVEGRYCLVATGRAPSTVGPPLFDALEGVRQALEQLQSITGRDFLDEQDALIKPIRLDGSGVDAFTVCTSAGPSVRTVLVGLMPGVSLDSARRLAASSYMNVMVEISLLDGRKDEERIDAIIAARPHLILILGGTNAGATDSVLRLVKAVGLAVSLMPEDQLPGIVFAGNEQLSAEVSEIFHNYPSVALLPNLRPNLEQEDLGPVHMRLAEFIADLRSGHVIGYEELDDWASGTLMLSADAFGRVMTYLSEVHGGAKGVLGVDLGASHTTIASAFDGNPQLCIQSDLGLGASLPGLLNHRSMSDIMRWLPMDLAEGVVLDYIYNKALHSRTVPVELDELYIEFALARELISTALEEARRSWPADRISGSSLLPAMEPIIAGGSALSHTPHPGYAAIALLDALQPVGVSTLVLDPYGLAPGLGAIASLAPIVTVQVLGSGSFISLGTVIAPSGRGRPGRSMLRYELTNDRTGERMKGEVKVGQLVALPLRPGETGRMVVRPERGFSVGFGLGGRGGRLRVTGGAVGLIIDGRGRPLRLPHDPARRMESNRRWLENIGIKI